MRTRAGAVLVVVATAALLAGCGGGGPTEATDDQATDIQAVLDSYSKAILDGDGKTICAELISPDDPVAGDQTACVDAYSQKGEAAGTAQEVAKAFQTADVDHIDVTEDGNLARLYFAGSDQFVRFANVDGQWYLAPTAPS
jgi:hypothetical protein